MLYFRTDSIKKAEIMTIADVITKFSKNTEIVVYIKSYDSPVGKVSAAADDEYLYIVCIEDGKNFEKKFEALANELSCQFVEGKNKVLQKFEEEIMAYFEGKLKKFTVPIKTYGSEFQKSVWDKLRELPFGSTQTYGDVAKSLGRSASHSRAIGAACGANTLFLVIPCHRVVATGSKGGFNSGIDRKEKLLQHEKKFA